MGAARAAVPEDVVLMGNLNPSDPMCMGTPDQVRQQAKALIEATRGQGDHPQLRLRSGCQHQAGKYGRPGGIRPALRHPGAAGSTAGLRAQEGETRYDPHHSKPEADGPDRRKGSQLWSIRSADGTEYLWQGDSPLLSDRALNLFPQIGLCTNDTYTVGGKTYSMDIHGFIKDTILTLTCVQKDRLTLACGIRRIPWGSTPFPSATPSPMYWRTATIHVTVSVENTGDQRCISLWADIPASICPWNPACAMRDYFLQFPEGSTARRAECTPGDCRMLGQVTDYPLINDRIPLSHELFADRVLILTGMPKTVTLRSEEGKKQVTVSYPDMRYLGIWKCWAPRPPMYVSSPGPAYPPGRGSWRTMPSSRI